MTMIDQTNQTAEANLVWKWAQGLASTIAGSMAELLGAVQMLRRRLPADDQAGQRYLATIGSIGGSLADTASQAMAWQSAGALNDADCDPVPLVRSLIGMLQAACRQSHTISDALDVSDARVSLSAADLRLLLAMMVDGVTGGFAQNSRGELTVAMWREPDEHGHQQVICTCTLKQSELTTPMLDELPSAITTPGVAWHWKVEADGSREVRLALPQVSANDVATDRIAPPSPNAEPSKGLVLLVEDDQQLAMVTGGMLRAMGYQIQVAEHGGRALEILADDATERRINAVLLDLMMPEVDGVEVYRHLRTQRPTLPVIVTSGHSSDPAVAELLREGVVAFLQKPYGLGALSACLRRVLGNEASGSRRAVRPPQ